MENAVNAVLVAVAEMSSQCIDETRRGQQQPFLPLPPQHGFAQGERSLQLRQVAREGGGGGERRSAKGRSRERRIGRRIGRSRRGGNAAVQGAAPSAFPGALQCPTPTPQHPQPQATVVVGIRRRRQPPHPHCLGQQLFATVFFQNLFLHFSHFVVHGGVPRVSCAQQQLHRPSFLHTTGGCGAVSFTEQERGKKK